LLMAGQLAGGRPACWWHTFRFCGTRRFWIDGTLGRRAAAGRERRLYYLSRTE
jgi:hypothetical protein